MSRLFAFVLAAYLVLASVAAQTRDASDQLEEASAVRIATVIVEGVSAGDLLNIRATASPVGKVLGRLPNGAVLHRHECTQFNGYDWCRVDAVEEEDVSGWTPARYLRIVQIEELATAAISALANGAGEAGQPADAEATALPPGLEARFASAEPIAAALPQRTQEPAADDDAERGDAYAGVPAPSVPIPTPRPDRENAGTATAPVQLAARLEALPAETSAALLGVGSVEASPPPRAEEAEPAAADEPPAIPELDAARVPIPTPRPGREPVAAEDPAPEPARREIVVAQLGPVSSSAAAPADAGGDIPCARYIGQPMTRCATSVARGDAGSADITVLWPDGGSRLIEFRDGEPYRSNSRQEFRFTREGTLSLIRVGVSERFEISDSVAFGD